MFKNGLCLFFLCLTISGTSEASFMGYLKAPLNWLGLGGGGAAAEAGSLPGFVDTNGTIDTSSATAPSTQAGLFPELPDLGMQFHRDPAFDLFPEATALPMPSNVWVSGVEKPSEDHPLPPQSGPIRSPVPYHPVPLRVLPIDPNIMPPQPAVSQVGTPVASSPALPSSVPVLSIRRIGEIDTSLNKNPTSTSSSTPLPVKVYRQPIESVTLPATTTSEPLTESKLITAVTKDYVSVKGKTSSGQSRDETTEGAKSTTLVAAKGTSLVEEDNNGSRRSSTVVYRTTQSTLAPAFKPQFLYHSDFAAQLNKLYYNKPIATYGDSQGNDVQSLKKQ